MVAFLGREEALIIRVGVSKFLCSNKSEILFVFLLKALLHFDNKIYKNNSNILIIWFMRLIGYLILLIIVFIIGHDNSGI